MTVRVAIAPYSVAPLRVEWRPLATLNAIIAEWRALAEHALEANVFYEPVFALAAAPVFGKNAGAALVWSQQRLLGLFPARRERRYGLPLPVLTGWTHPYGPLGTPLVARDDAEAVIAAWLDHLASDRQRPGLMLLPLVPEHGPLAAALASVLARRNCPCAMLGRHRRAVLVPGDQRESYLEHAIGAKKRKELRRQRHRLAEQGAVAADVATQPPALGGALRDFLALEARGWKGRAGTAAAADKGVRQFVERAVIALAAEGKARIDRLTLDGRPVAATVTLRSGAVAWTWKIAYDEAFARFSPGVQLMLDLTEALLADTSITRIDSCATPDHPMIDHLWRERVALSDRLIAVRGGRTAFALGSRLEALRRTAAASAKMLRDRMR